MHRFVLYISFNETFFFTKLVQYRVIFLFSFYIKKNFQIYDFFFYLRSWDSRTRIYGSKMTTVDRKRGVEFVQRKR